MDYNELTAKNLGDLQKLLAEKRKELQELKFKVSENAMTNVREIRKVKKHVAQLLTAINAKNKEAK